MDDVFPDELRAVLRLTLKPSKDLVSALDEDREIPNVGDIIQEVLFQRHFLPTYLAVVAVTVLIWASAKQFTNHRISRRQKFTLREKAAPSSVASSSSSTLLGTESPPTVDNDFTESTPLLAEAQLQQQTTPPLYLRVWLSVKSFLLRQPKPIPSLTAPKNTLPANEISVVILLFLALNVFYLFYRMPFTARHVFTFADRAGLLFVVNLPVLYILAAKNNQPLGWITGWSYEGLNIFHRRLGEWMTTIAIFHAAGMIVGFYQLLAPFGYTLVWYLTRRIIIFGVIAFAGYMAIYFTSIGYFRQRMYELFLALHVLLQVVALVMLFFHHHDARPYVGAAIAIWGLDRLVSRMLCKTRSFVATLEIAKDKETVLLYCNIPVRKRRGIGMQAGWYAGQHVFLTVPEIGSLHRLQAHPFTIASPAPSHDENVGTWPLQLTIRAQDGFSRELLEYAKLHQHTRIYLDGPYSSDEVLKAVKRCDRIALIAGGSGIAVTYPFAWAREVKSSWSSDILHDRALYHDGRKQLPNVTKSARSLDESRFAHFWIRQDFRHEGWVTMLPRKLWSSSERVKPGSHCDITSGAAIDLITHRFDTRNAEGEHQRPDVQAELDAWVKGDLKRQNNKDESICIVVSGPDGLVRDVQNAVAKLVGQGWNVEIHVEKFGW